MGWILNRVHRWSQLEASQWRRFPNELCLELEALTRVSSSSLSLKSRRANRNLREVRSLQQLPVLTIKINGVVWPALTLLLESPSVERLNPIRKALERRSPAPSLLLLRRKIGF